MCSDVTPKKPIFSLPFFVIVFVRTNLDHMIEIDLFKVEGTKGSFG